MNEDLVDPAPPAPPATPIRIGMTVYGDLTYDSRVQREAVSLAAAGYRVVVGCLSASPATVSALAPVEVVAVTPGGGVLPTGDSPFLLPAGDGAGSTDLPGPRVVRRVLSLAGRAVGRVRWLVGYRSTLVAWGRAVVAEAGPVDRWHAHDLTGLLAVDGVVAAAVPRVYDAHELFVETGSAARLPWMGRRLIARLEGRLARRCAAVVAVNPGIAAVLRRWHRLDEIVVVRNCLPRQVIAAEPRPRRLHERLGLNPDVPVILFHGNLAEDRGIERIVELLASGALGAAHFVCLGNGELAPWLHARAAEPAMAGRLHVLPAVPPAELPAWVASADAGAVLQQPADRNLRLSTPNKLWECLAVGTPVVASDFPEIRRVVVGDPDGPLGAVCDPVDDASVARAFRTILDPAPEERAALRRRCLRAAHERWNWETEAARLVALHRSLDPA